MAVLITADVPHQTQEGYDQVLAAVGPALRAAKGFIAHGAGPVSGGWQAFELWESQEDATRFFAEHIHPHLPPGITPKRSILELYSLVRA